LPIADFRLLIANSIANRQSKIFEKEYTMSPTGVTLLLDLHECKSPALGNQAVLEQIVVSALQFAGLEVLEQVVHRVGESVAVLCVLRDAHACLHALPATGFVCVEVSALGKPDAARAAIEIVRGYLAQKLIARSVNARVIERGTNTSAP
jgi:S-adenosylmethionine/arginine decarboxylase-like enzyme